MSGAEAFVTQEHSDSERLAWLEANLDRLETIKAGIRAGMSIRTAIDLLMEPLYFPQLEKMAGVPRAIIRDHRDLCVLCFLPAWVRESFEDARVPSADEVWIFNALQHVRDPELVVSKAKETAPVVRFFEPVDYPTCVYHPHTFTQQDFERWFGSSVKRYTDRKPGFFDADCVYGTWQRAAEVA